MLLKAFRSWWRRRRAARITIPRTLWNRVERDLPCLARLDEHQRERLRALAREFLVCKQFHGAGGLELNDEIMLAIALQACLPVLNIGLHVYDEWVGIIVYPSDIRVRRHETDDAGVVHEFNDEILGEAWEDGPVVLVWSPHTALGDDANVVIHEFVHKLDMSNGAADGYPPLPSSVDREAWADDFGQAYAQLCKQIERNLDTPIDPYAGESPAEFFAVASESFFQDPARLAAAYPRIYAHLSRLYGLDPLAAREVA